MLKQLSMSKKIYAVIGVLATVAVVIAVIGNLYLGQLNQRIDHLANVTAEQVRIGGKLIEKIEKMQRAEKNLLLATSQEEMEEYVKEMAGYKQAVQEDLTTLKGLADETGQALIADFEARWKEYTGVNQQVQELALLNSNVKAKQLSQGDAQAAFEQAEEQLKVLADRNQETIATSTNLTTVKKAAKKGSIATQAQKKLVAMQRGEKNLILAKSQEVMDHYSQKISQAEQELTALFSQLVSQAQAGKEVQLVNTSQAGFQTYQTLDQEVRDLSRENGNNRAFDLSAGDGRQTLLQAKEALKSLTANADESMDKAIETSDAKYAAARIMMIGISVLGIAGALALAIFLMRGLTRNLNRLIRRLSQGAEQVSEASGQVSSSSQELAEGSTEQASSVEETSASLEEMDSMTKQNRDGAKRANQMAEEAMAAAETGDSRMEQMKAAMNEVSDSADETSKIIKTIDEIAFQTNLLALNAAVEAARAGEAGQGFAVVADEVRNLAQRAAEAAKDTAELIEGSKTNTEKSVGIVKEVGDSLEEITEHSKKVNELVQEITVSSDEQSEGIEQINVAMAQVDEVTQGVASNAEESAAAAEELNSQAETLMISVEELQVMVEGQGHAGTIGSNGHTKPKAIKRAHELKTATNGSGAKEDAKPAKTQSSNGNRGTSGEETLIPFDEDEDEDADFSEF